MRKAIHSDLRDTIVDLQQIPNVAPAPAGDLKLIGIETPSLLVKANPLELYKALCEKTGVRHDLCMLDVFMAAVDFMNGNPPKPWWQFTETRKEILSKRQTTLV